MTLSDTEQLRQWRRMFHQLPEPGWSEFITTARLIEMLRAMGYRVLPGAAFLSREHIQGRNEEEVAQGLARARAFPVEAALLAEMEALTGCVALLETGGPGPTIALRFDIDCVAVHESEAPQHRPQAAGFASRHPGCMHACGHDGHMTIGLGVAQTLYALRDRLCGTVKLLFQPAEEGVRGAKPVAEGGILDDVDYFLSAHIGMGGSQRRDRRRSTRFSLHHQVGSAFLRRPGACRYDASGGSQRLGGRLPLRDPTPGDPSTQRGDVTHQHRYATCRRRA